jgi:hypothetical protein
MHSLFIWFRYWLVLPALVMLPSLELVADSGDDVPKAKLLYGQNLFKSPRMASGGSATAKSEIMENGKKLPVAQDFHGVAQYRIPQITQTAAGDLIVAVSARLSQPSDFGMSTTFFAKSKNRGKTWNYFRSNTDYSDEKRIGNNAGGFPLTQGTQDAVIIQQPETEIFTSVYLDKKNSTVYTTQSQDLEEWSKPVPLPHNEEFNTLCPGPASPVIDPVDGSIVMMIHGNGKTNEVGRKIRKNGAYLFRSPDGKNFHMSRTPMPGSEAAVVPLGGGRYLAESRGSIRRMALFRDDRYVSSWAFPEKSYPLCAASLARYGNSIYFLTPTVDKRKRGVLYRSRDEGKTWNALCVVHQEYFSYSSLTVLDERHIAIVAERNFNPAERDLMNIYFSVLELPSK